jgi:hypothetical protein
MLGLPVAIRKGKALLHVWLLNQKKGLLVY